MPKLIKKLISALLIVIISVAANAEINAKTTGIITGYSFHDLNSNGIDDYEPRLNGFSIVVKNVEGVAVQVGDLTGSNGYYHFQNLPFQKYIICEVLPSYSKWLTTTEQCVELELTEENSGAMILFGNRPVVETDIGCTRNQSYWSNTVQGDLLLKFLVQPQDVMYVGLIPYKLSELNRILDEPVAGNALLTLSQQIITTKTNILAGASSVTIAVTLADADSAIGSLTIPPESANFIDPTTKPGMAFLALAAQLERFNSGMSQIPACK
jgi:hypothetical protein